MKQQTVFLAYDTMCSINVRAAQPGSDIPGLLQAAEETALRLERTLSMFDPDSELSRLCAAYTPGVPVPISPLMADFLAINLDMAARSGGAFDPTVGRLVKLWDFLADTPRVPDAAALDTARQSVGYRHVTLDAAAGTVTIHVPGLTLDPGASGKGLALGLAEQGLRQGGVTEAVLDFGGNLFVIGAKRAPGADQARPWRVAIRDPDCAGQVIGTVALADAGIATSSWYEHCFQKDGRVYHHLLDPRTGAPMPLTLKSVSILSSHAVFTDLVSTAFFILGEDKGCALVRQLCQDSGQRIDYVLVREDGSIGASPDAHFTPA